MLVVSRLVVQGDRDGPAALFSDWVSGSVPTASPRGDSTPRWHCPVTTVTEATCTLFDEDSDTSRRPWHRVRSIVDPSLSAWSDGMKITDGSVHGTTIAGGGEDRAVLPRRRLAHVAGPTPRNVDRAAEAKSDHTLAIGVDDLAEFTLDQLRRHDDLHRRHRVSH